MHAPTPRDTSPGGIVRASALPALPIQNALPAAAPIARARPNLPAIAPLRTTEPGGGRLRLLAPLRSRSMRVLAFDAAVLGALLSFLTELLALGAGLDAVDGGHAMLLAALTLTACWAMVLRRDVRRLFTLLRRWR